MTNDSIEEHNFFPYTSTIFELLVLSYKKEDVVWLPMRQLPTKDQNDTDINNYRSPYLFILIFIHDEFIKGDCYISRQKNTKKLSNKKRMCFI